MKTVFSFIVLFGCLLFCGFAQSTETRFDISEWESSRKISKVTDKYECILYVFARNSREECEAAMSDIISNCETEDFMSSPVKATVFQFGAPNRLLTCVQFISTTDEKDKKGKKIKNTVLYESYTDESENELTKEQFIKECKRTLDSIPDSYREKSEQALQTLERLNKKIW